MLDHIRLLFNDTISKGKSSQKTEKVLIDLRELSAFRQNVIFGLVKSMQHMADTIFLQASNMTLASQLTLGIPQTRSYTLYVPLGTAIFITQLSSWI